MTGSASPYSAAASALGFFYQPRLGLLRLLSQPESTTVLIEMSDDLEFDASSGAKSLMSLKHKADGDALTALDPDFWKSVRVWLKHYLDDGRMASTARFLLLTTALIAEGSFLEKFADDQIGGSERATAAGAALAESESETLVKIRDVLAVLTEAEAADFYARITILDGSPRIEEIPQLVLDQHLRTVRREARTAVFERLEGWWSDQMIELLVGRRTDPIRGYEVSDRMMLIAEEYRSDSLPITFGNRQPDGTIDVANDSRLFVEQLRQIDVSAVRIQKAIIDYYRAFEQRSSWARENLLVAGEIEDYEARLIDEWERYREIVFEQVADTETDDRFKSAARELYRWAEVETGHLRIRERVAEPYVVRGGFQILANARPKPRVFWNPRFMQRLAELLEVAA